VLYFHVHLGLFGFVFNVERQFWALFIFNTAALVVWEFAAQRIAWLAERWGPRLLALASGTVLTLLAIESIFVSAETSVLVWFVYPLWLAGMYGTYRRRIHELFMLAGGCLSAIVVVTALLAKVFLEGRAEAVGYFLVAIAVIGMAAGAGWWLKEIAQEGRE
jgi:hypothetical protein